MINQETLDKIIKACSEAGARPAIYTSSDSDEYTVALGREWMDKARDDWMGVESNLIDKLNRIGCMPCADAYGSSLVRVH